MRVGYAGTLVGLALLAPGAALAQTATTSTSSSTFEILTQVSDGRRNESFQTEVSGVVDGVEVFSTSFIYQFNNSVVQNALAPLIAPRGISVDGRAAIVTFGSASLIDTREDFLDSFTDTFITTLAPRLEVTTQITYGDLPNPVIYVGDRGNCFDMARSGATNAAPFDGAFPGACDGNDETEVAPGEVNTNTHTTTINETIETQFTNEDYLITEIWQYEGDVTFIGGAHTSVQSTMFERGNAFLTRLGLLPVANPAAGGAAFWTEAYTGRSEADAEADVDGQFIDTSGIAFGVVASPWRNWTAGLAVEYGASTADVEGASESADVSLTLLGAHIGFAERGLYAMAAATYGAGEADTMRGNAGLGGVSNANYDVRSAGFGADVGFQFGGPAFNFGPAAGVEWVSIEGDAFAETSGVALISDGLDADRTRSWIGVVMGSDFTWGGANVLHLQARLRAVEIVSGDDNTLDVTFAATPGTSLVIVGPGAGSSNELNLQARIALGAAIDLHASLDAAQGDGEEWRRFALGFRTRW